MNGDETSEFARRAINILFVANPKGTSIGILIGVVLDGVIGFFTPLLKTIEWASISAVKIWHLMGLGAVVMNLPAYLARKDVDPSIVNAFKLIDEKKANGSISDLEAGQEYLELVKAVVGNVTLNSDTEKQVDRVAAIANQSSGESKSKK
ncbi:hypothetical protein PSH61_01480 [Pseudomonas rhodesiae]|uniref:hypothetical protein n=1 Tax=Pseudomonas rhodesiae TaxID=76760 RepID=UPI000B8BF3D0|nr:hypothetical protein [Pseudomonas rhodesiae]OXS20700.1 hypothetical protein CGU36_19415 [Pseudomonas fluorescens]OZO46105.1 hypothetical protein CGU37_25855 [Pseudomonas fluorescens]TGY16345.1 hypothetical protein E5845_18170 [Pseudomonas fluorescens]WLI29804.1 hypothetical protein PSH61_01480 [Pseudomonas rhodesiae]